MNDERLNNVPLILETPCSHEGVYADEINLLYGLEGNVFSLLVKYLLHLLC